MNYLTLSLAAALAATGYGWQAERAAHANTKAAHSAYVTQATEATLDLTTQVLEATSELQNAQATHEQEVASLHQLAERHRSAAHAASGRLQDAAAAAAARARAQCPGASAADMGEAAADPVGVLTLVLGELDQFAGAVAANADEGRIAGLACERRYEELSEALRAAAAP